MLDLSSLGGATPAQAAAPNGAPLEIPLVLIVEDPEQPRSEFDAASLDELAASIRQSGVKSPVSVRRVPDNPDHWVLNYGARRLRASRLAGKVSIPAFVDEAHDSYDQVIENLQRDDLKPMELALFVQKRITQGEKKGEIAKALGKSADFVTNHLALIDMPEALEALYASGGITSAKLIYDLRTLRKKDPAAVDAWLDGRKSITRYDIDDLRETLNYISGKAEKSQYATENPDCEPDTGEHAAAETIDEDESDAADGQEKFVKIKKPMLHVLHGKKRAVLMLNERPRTDGLAYIYYEDASSDKIEVALKALTLHSLTDAAP